MIGLAAKRWGAIALISSGLFGRSPLGSPGRARWSRHLKYGNRVLVWLGRQGRHQGGQSSLHGSARGPGDL